MTLREPVIADWRFVFECYEDWPLTEKGPVTVDVAVAWLRRWIARSDEIAMIGVETIALQDTAVSVITYRRDGDEIVIDNIVVHPNYRGLGYATETMRALQSEVVTDGVTRGYFECLPGPIADMVTRGRFANLGEKIGPRSGLPLVCGEVFDDTVI